jgi:hypothetical protein
MNNEINNSQQKEDWKECLVRTAADEAIFYTPMRLDMNNFKKENERETEISGYYGDQFVFIKKVFGITELIKKTFSTGINEGQELCG